MTTTHRITTTAAVILSLAAAGAPPAARDATAGPASAATVRPPDKHDPSRRLGQSPSHTVVRIQTPRERL